ncbi:uncharacterized protein LOC126419764 [Schistocerca serialis cubense]|uniref:uncharacterized protein LOC126419764 n=1 Tax=Schistocerca serialis cubense TaxID=2023355 RepID=UPI00214E692F|nr:uncharacterized protein LOC126419764 [Schistocerca serialis cubense]
MAKPSIYSELLLTNLELLFMNHPPAPELQGILQKNLFSVPNKRASDELICYLFSLIDGDKYNIKQNLLYIMLDKKRENSFYSQVHNFSKDISDEYPEENLPKVVKSFFLMPSGEKYVQYLYKLTLIAMKNDLKMAGIVMHPARRPKDEEELTKLESMNDILDEHLKMQTKCAEQSYVKNKNKERLLKLQIERKRKVLMELTADLKLKMEKYSLPEHMKSLVFSGYDQKVIKEWSTALSQRCENLQKDAEVIKNIKWNISQLHKAITQKKNGTLGKCSSYLRNEPLNGLLPEDFLNNLLRQAEETLNALRLEGPADLSPYIPELEDLTKEFKDMLDIVSHCSQFIIQLHDETETQIPRLEAALFSDEQLEAKIVEDEAAGCGHSLINKLCESTPPEMLRNLRIAELTCTPPMKNHETESQNASRTDAVNEEDMTDVTESYTPVALDTNLLKPICFERKCGGSTWKHALLLSTLKKKNQQKENPISYFQNGMCSPESLTDTPLAQPNKRTSNPVKSLNNLWTEDSENFRNYCVSKKTLHAELPSDTGNLEKSSLTINSAVNNQGGTECHVLGVPDSGLGSEMINQVFPGLLQLRSGTSSSEAVKALIIQDQNKVSGVPVHHRPSGRHSSEEENSRISDIFASGNFSQEFHNFMQAVTNSNGSLMGASSVFDSSSSPSPPGSNMTGIHMLEHTSLDFMHMSSNADSSLAHWDDQKDLKRILSVALSPAGISPAEVRSSTPINSSSSSQQEQNGHAKEGEKQPQPAVGAYAVSRIPRIKSLGGLRLKEMRSTLSREDQF